MGVVEQTSGAVESQLSALEESYGSFSVNQRTVTVPTAEYERKRNESGCKELDVHAKVLNDKTEVLYVDEDGREVLPSTTTTFDVELHRVARQTVDEMAGITCQIDGLEAVTILGLHDGNDESRETVYTLAVLFEGEHTSGTAGAGAVWKSFDPNDHPVYA
ncbi:hypothetical protein GRX03_12990 [Halovenus sp. WSH3]|uniref:Uncharacterized protein n=1 Tax=Halovenus carboxidivorans TaxID=2692199 RepID=A0A6B0TH42_9EURY|nr:hypothetical protein [Halovenus carboxidivorans]MXR52519.1 hypothetical protein [Halovenus carboxidivorans]